MQKTWENEELICCQEGKIQYIQFKRLLEYPEIAHCYTLRSGDELNFPPIYKDEKMLKQSYQKICSCLELNPETIMKPHQTHTDRVEIIDEIKQLNEVDGMITNKSNITLLTTSADCISLLFYDPVRKVIGDVHSGWKGTLQAIAKKAAQKMIQEYNSRPEDIICCICPCIKQCCFEVDEDVKNLFEQEYENLENMENIIKKGDIVEEKQKYYIDTTEINRQLLINVGLKASNIIDSKICTKCNSNYFHSYRVDREKSGRNAAIIGLREVL